MTSNIINGVLPYAFHVLDSGLRVACQAHRANNDAGVKWWCPICFRFVLPDQRHKFLPRLVPSGFAHNQRKDEAENTG